MRYEPDERWLKNSEYARSTSKKSYSQRGISFCHLPTSKEAYLSGLILSYLFTRSHLIERDKPANIADRLRKRMCEDTERSNLPVQYLRSAFPLAASFETRVAAHELR